MNKQALIDEIAALANRIEGDEYDEGVRSAVLHSLALVNKHLPDNEVSVPAEPTEAMIEAGCLALAGSIGGYEAGCVEVCYKAMLQAHKSEEV